MISFSLKSDRTQKMIAGKNLIGLISNFWFFKKRTSSNFKVKNFSGTDRIQIFNFKQNSDQSGFGFLIFKKFPERSGFGLKNFRSGADSDFEILKIVRSGADSDFEILKIFRSGADSDF